MLLLDTADFLAIGPNGDLNLLQGCVTTARTENAGAFLQNIKDSPLVLHTQGHKAAWYSESLILLQA